MDPKLPLRPKLRPSPGMRRTLWMVATAAIGLAVVTGSWEWWFTNSNSLVVYFGRPDDVPAYAMYNVYYLIWASWDCLWTALASLLLAGFLAVALLTLGVLRVHPESS